MHRKNLQHVNYRGRESQDKHIVNSTPHKLVFIRNPPLGLH